MPNTNASTADTPDASRPDIAERFDTGAWRFTPAVADVFPDHVRASVPFYDAIQDLVAEAADWLLPDEGTIADLGAATGITVHRIASRHPERRLRAFLYDTEPAMLDRARESLSGLPNLNAEYRPADIRQPLRHDGADLTLAIFTLQFLSLPDRILALSNARHASSPSGAIIVAEKVRPQDSRWAEIANDASHDYKAAQGVTDTAIRAKARALRGVLIPYPHTALTEVVRAGGWCTPEPLFRWHSWVVCGAYATPTGL